MMSLQKIVKEIEDCRGCRKGKHGLAVPGEGNPHAKIMFVGMAPGREEAKEGRPFIGRSGKLLTEMLRLIGIDRDDVYITSPVKYYPGARSLRADEIRHGMMHLEKQVKAISPRLIVLLGDVAAKALLPEKRLKVTVSHGKFFEKGGIRYFITFHPAAALRFRRIRKLMEKDLRKLAEQLP